MYLRHTLTLHYDRRGEIDAGARPLRRAAATAIKLYTLVTAYASWRIERFSREILFGAWRQQRKAVLAYRCASASTLSLETKG